MSNSQNQIPDAAQRQAWEALWRRLLMPGDGLSPQDDEQEFETETTASANSVDETISSAQEANR